MEMLAIELKKKKKKNGGKEKYKKKIAMDFKRNS